MPVPLLNCWPDKRKKSIAEHWCPDDCQSQADSNTHSWSDSTGHYMNSHYWHADTRHRSSPLESSLAWSFPNKRGCQLRRDVALPSASLSPLQQQRAVNTKQFSGHRVKLGWQKDIVAAKRQVWRWSQINLKKEAMPDNQNFAVIISAYWRNLSSCIFSSVS